MGAGVEALPDFGLDCSTALGGWFEAKGLTGYRGAARHVRDLPYGRNSDRANYRLVLEENRGTCSTKHAVLAALARDHGSPVELRLGIYKMDGRNTPGVGPVLSRHGLLSVPEAHCYLAYRGTRVDLTRAAPGGAIDCLVHEEVAEPAAIGSYKAEMHKRFVASWASERGLDSERVWRVREECISALSEE